MQEFGKFPKKPESPHPARLYEFGPFRLNQLKRIVLRDGEPLPLTPKCFDILLALVERAGEVLVKEELIENVWPDTVVEEGNLNRNISTLRKALGESPNDHLYIVTVPGRGYRFVAPVQERSAASGETSQNSFVKHGEGAAPRSRVWPLRVAIAGLCAVALVAGGTAFKKRSQLFSVAPRRIHSVAVLPLQNLSGNPSEDYLADGLTEALVTDLAQVRSLRVISRTSIMTYKGSKKKLPEIARELNVDAIVEGSVTRLGDQVQVTAQLVEAPTDTHLWANTYKGDARDILGLQSTLAREVVQEIRVALTPEEETRLSTVRLIDPEAHEAYLKGRYLWNQRTPESTEKSVAYFQEAVQKDPQYAAAYLALGEAYALLGANDIEAPQVVVPKAKQAARKALELDSGLGEAHATLAQLAFYNDWDFRAAEQEFRQALDESPNYATAHQWYGILLMAEKRFDEAAREFNAALAIDPLSLITSSDLGQVYFYSGRLDKTIAQTQKILEIDPGFAPAHDLQGMAYEQQGNYEQAMAEFQKYSELTDGGTDAKMHLAHLYAVTGRGPEARKLLWELENPSRGKFASPYDMATIYVALGDNENALRWLDRAYKERATMMPMAGIDPLLSALRKESRFQQLLRRVGVPQ